MQSVVNIRSQQRTRHVCNAARVTLAGSSTPFQSYRQTHWRSSVAANAPLPSNLVKCNGKMLTVGYDRQRLRCFKHNHTCLPALEVWPTLKHATCVNSNATTSQPLPAAARVARHLPRAFSFISTSSCSTNFDYHYTTSQFSHAFLKFSLS